MEVHDEKGMLPKIGAIIAGVVIVALLGKAVGLNFQQVMSITIFASSVFATIVFWNFRLAIVFIGIALLVFSKTIDIKHLVEFSSLEVIFFLVGMMVIVGLLREVNFFTWVLGRILCIRNLSGKKLVLLVCLISTLLACAVDEVTSILFMIAFVLEICSFYEMNPVPLIIMSVMTTNIGSAGTVMGNPIGVLIATKAGLTFEDFLIWATPLMLIAFLVATILLMWWYRNWIRELDVKMKSRATDSAMFCKLVKVPLSSDIKHEMAVFVITIVLLALHYRLELLFGFPKNAILLIVPLTMAGLVMLWRRGSARKYIEQDVDWWTLVFFMLLFAQAGTVDYVGTTDVFAKKLVAVCGPNQALLTSAVLWIAAIGSSVLDNVVLVSAFIPIVQSLAEIGVNAQPLWWALLFGGCFGGNITMVGSTANIVALGMMEKRAIGAVNFFQWLKIGGVVGVVTTVIVWILLLLLSPLMGEVYG